MSDTEKSTTTDEEPTMEEILTSIRRIISDDETNEEKQDKNNSAEHVPKEGQVDEVKAGEEENLLVLAEGDIETEPLSEGMDELELSTSDMIEDTSVTRIDEDAEKIPKTEPILKQDEAVSLMSENQAASAAETLAGLSDALSQGQDIPLGSTDKTLEEIIKELLRPLLQIWLDKNLPPLVEKLVNKEIKKLVSRAEDQI